MGGGGGGGGGLHVKMGGFIGVKEDSSRNILKSKVPEMPFSAFLGEILQNLKEYKESYEIPKRQNIVY